MTSPGFRRRCARTTSSHLAECALPRRQKFHRGLDVTLAAAHFAGGFLLSSRLAVLKHIKPLEHVAFNMLGLESSTCTTCWSRQAIAGLCFSVIAFALVLMATPAPTYLGGIAAERAGCSKSVCRMRSSLCACVKLRSAIKVQRPPEWEAFDFALERFLPRNSNCGTINPVRRFWDFTPAAFVNRDPQPRIGTRRSPPVISFGSPSSSRFSSVGEMSRSEPSVRRR